MSSGEHRLSLSTHEKDGLWSSIASSSAVVSETIVDSWPVEKLQIESNDTHLQEHSGLGQSAMNLGSGLFTEDGDGKSSKGVNRHNYSPESIQRILEQQHKEKVNQVFYQNSYDLSNQSKRHQGRGGRTRNEQTSGNVLPSVASTVIGVAGFVSRWVQVQKIKRQKEALERAVEEQRRILLKQTLCTENKGPDEDECEEKSRWQRERISSREAGLKGNGSFQSTQQQEQVPLQESTRRTISTLSFCVGGSCVQEEDAYDSCFDDESRQSFEEYIASVQKIPKNPDTNHIIDDDSAISYESCSRNGDKDTFKIGSPCHTLSGEGIAVQLEIFDRHKHRDWHRHRHRYSAHAYSGDDDATVNIQKEQNTVPFILNPDQMRSIAVNGLPASIMFSKWKRLYSLQRDGDSFTTSFLNKVRGEARTLLVIQTTKNEIMGGYSNSPWESQSGSVGAAFYGSCQASLFKICRKDNAVKLFKWTYNLVFWF